MHLIVSLGAETEESLKECGKNREAMRLCREGECSLCNERCVFVLVVRTDFMHRQKSVFSASVVGGLVSWGP